MKNILTTGSFAIAFAAFAGQATAADLAGSYKDAPTYVAPVNWSGFYAGVNAGAAENSGRTTYAYSYARGNGTANFSDLFGSAADNIYHVAGPANIPGMNAVQSAEYWGIIPATLGPDSNTGFTGGGQIGYNVQSGSFVIGAEADFNWMNQSSSGQLSGTVPSLFTNTQQREVMPSTGWAL